MSVKADKVPKFIVSVQNPTNHDITLVGRTVIGTVQSVRSVYPANIFKTDHLPTTSIHHSQAQSSSGSTPAHEQWDPPVNLTHLDEHQRQIASQMLREESESFSRSDDNISCVENQQMTHFTKGCCASVENVSLCSKTLIQGDERLLTGPDSARMG